MRQWVRDKYRRRDQTLRLRHADKGGRYHRKKDLARFYKVPLV
jgi:hypothetical protein